MKTRTKVLWSISVITLLAIIVGGVWWPRHRAASLRHQCLNNLRILSAPMICCVPAEFNLKDGDRLNPTNVLAYMKGNTLPVCPAGGTYIISWIVGGPNPTCSVHGDLLFECDGMKTLKDGERELEKQRRQQRNN